MTLGLNRLAPNRRGAGAGTAAADTAGTTYTVSGLKVGSSAILYGNGSQIATATVDGTGKATWTLGAKPAAGTIITYDGVVVGSGGIVPVVVPAPPAMTLTAGNGQVTISWVDGATGGSAITSHNLFRGTASGSLQLVGNITTASPYIDSGLTNGTTYIYQISAKNSVGESVRSAESTVTAGLIVAVPDVVLDFVNGSYTSGGSNTTPSANLTTARSAAALDDSLTSVAANTLRITSAGLLGEPDKTPLNPYTNDMSSTGGTRWAVSGSTKTDGAALGPFISQSVIAVPATAPSIATAPRIGVNTASLTAFVPVSLTCWYMPGTSGNIAFGTQQTFGGFGTSFVAGPCAGPIGTTSNQVGQFFNTRVRTLTIAGQTVYELRTTFTPFLTGVHKINLGPYSIVPNETIIALGAQAELGGHSALIPTAATPAVRPGDSITATGPLAAILEAASGHIRLDLNKITGTGSILSAASEAVQMLRAEGRGELTAKSGSATLTPQSGSDTYLDDVNTVDLYWSPSGRGIKWNGGPLLTDTTALPAHATVKLFSGVQGLVRKITAWSAPQPLSADARAKGFFKPLAVYGGGYIVGIDIHSDGTRLIRADVYGAYRWDNTNKVYKNLINSTSMPSSALLKDVGAGIFLSAIAPNDSSRFYMMHRGITYKSINKGDAWTAAPITGLNIDANVLKETDANQGVRTTGHRMAVDPANKDVVIVGLPNSGVYLTTDGMATWTKLTVYGQTSATAGSQDSGFSFAFDPSSPVSGGRTQGLFIYKNGTGLYRSDDGGTNATLTTGTQTGIISDMRCGSNGDLWLLRNTAANSIYRYRAGAWTTITIGNGGAKTPKAIAINPANPLEITVLTTAGLMTRSTDGETFGAFNLGPSHVASDIPWLLWTNNNQPSVGFAVYDPSTTNKVFCCNGVGVAYFDPTASIPARVSPWTIESKGIIEMVANKIVTPPGRAPIFCYWDRPFFRVPDPDREPVDHGVNNVNVIVAGWHADFAKDNPDYIAGIANANSPAVTETSGYSTDGGRNWTLFAALPSVVNDTVPSTKKIGGCIAVGSASNPATANVVWFPSINAAPYWSKDNGATWTACLFGGSSITTGWGDLNFYKTERVCADPNNLGTFYAYNSNASGSGGGLWKTTDGGVNWTKLAASGLPTQIGFNVKLKMHTDGRLFFTAAQSSSQSLAAPAGNAFCISSDGGLNFTTIATMKDVNDFGFGKSAFYMVGYFNNSYGVWRTTDTTNFASFTRVGPDAFPMGYLDSISSLGADVNVDRVYINFQGSSTVYCDAA